MCERCHCEILPFGHMWLTLQSAGPAALGRRLLFPRPTLRGVWLAVLLLYSASCIILPIIYKGGCIIC